MTLAENLVALLRSRSLTVATAESCTGGLVSELITAVPARRRFSYAVYAPTRTNRSNPSSESARTRFPATVRYRARRHAKWPAGSGVYREPT